MPGIFTPEYEPSCSQVSGFMDSSVHVLLINGLCLRAMQGDMPQQKWPEKWYLVAPHHPGVPIDMMKHLLSQQAKYGPSHNEFIIIHPEKTMVYLPIFLLKCAQIGIGINPDFQTKIQTRFPFNGEMCPSFFMG